jgi:hypothetical protein
MDYRDLSDQELAVEIAKAKQWKIDPPLPDDRSVFTWWSNPANYPHITTLESGERLFWPAPNTDGESYKPVTSLSFCWSLLQEMRASGLVFMIEDMPGQPEPYLVKWRRKDEYVFIIICAQASIERAICICWLRWMEGK